MTKCECLGCEKRTLGCHSTCESYIRYAEERKQIREARMKEHEASGFYYSRLGKVEHELALKKKRGRGLSKSWSGE